MYPLYPLAVYQPWQLESEDPPDLEAAAARFLAEGDSWFSLGALNPAKNSNLLFEMAFSQRCMAINCAMPGDTLRRIVTMRADPRFVQLLAGRRARAWDAILLSAGGNDLIDAVRVPPRRADGTPVPRDRRLLLVDGEWGPATEGAARYLSAEGWTVFCDYLRANFDVLVALRDAPRSKSKGCPVFYHGYAVPTPRPAGAGFGFGPWLYPALVDYQIPAADMAAVARELIARLRTLLAGVAGDSKRWPRLYFFDTSAILLEPAAEGAEGESGDWLNEIHPTWRGYEKLALPWAAAIELALAG
jgi:hypothetical protein